ncbi:class I SAM-dependent methyltransferase [Vibrio tapetis subsp. quintayensis]|uniref:class I SAM-dependent methyltransferase n=1 Tax=Vibrio tapetis TaxID=52443 RepID=UPI0025B2AAFA|nr:class I SAM-dependent methyltransferase [Vibrio tapetis]MDN3679237.1 class I SAM-dependent methyltransferase [Vibrio tapetis subsp. quintayensis]
MTSSYYNSNAQEFYAGTVDVNMASLYARFVPLLSTGAKVLDAGCGSGRDTKHFIDNGFITTGFDASPELVALASELVDQTIQCDTFLSFTTDMKAFDAIWACASLLHVPYNDLEKTFCHLSQFLKNDGIFYCSFKYGDSELERHGRRFTDLNENSLSTLLSNTPLSIAENWITGDLREGRESEKWLNVILKKESK